MGPLFRPGKGGPQSCIRNGLSRFPHYRLQDASRPSNALHKPPERSTSMSLQETAPRACGALHEASEHSAILQESPPRALHLPPGKHPTSVQSAQRAHNLRACPTSVQSAQRAHNRRACPTSVHSIASAYGSAVERFITRAPCSSNSD